MRHPVIERDRSELFKSRARSDVPCFMCLYAGFTVGPSSDEGSGGPRRPTFLRRSPSELLEEVMRFGARRVAINALALVAVSGAITLVPPISAQTRDRGAGADMFRPFGAGSEIGVSVRELTNDEVSGATLDSPGGVYVQRVREGSPAARAGLRAGDIIVSVDGERVRGVRQFSRFVLESPAGRSVRAEIVRDGSRQVMSVTPEA